MENLWTNIQKVDFLVHFLVSMYFYLVITAKIWYNKCSCCAEPKTIYETAGILI